MDEKTLARFWQKVDRRGPDECWEWTAALNRYGYGKYQIKRGSVTAHRYIWEAFYGLIGSSEIQVLHSCDNRACVNPAHLSLGTSAENRRQWVRRGCKPQAITSRPRTFMMPSPEERFWQRARRGKRRACWLWSGAKTPGGYGVFWYERKNHPAHCFAYFLHHGRWPNPFGLHHCDNRACVNPLHIWEGTTQDNVADRCRKGRSASGDRNGARLHPERWARGDRHYSRTHPEKVARGDRHPLRLRPELAVRGEQNGRAKLRAADVRRIRSMRAEGALIRVIAEIIGTCTANVICILQGKTWRHLK